MVAMGFNGGDRGFRNRVKLVVGGRPGRIRLGILGPDGRGVDLRECAIQSPLIAAVIPAIASFLESSNLAPYDVPERRGELQVRAHHCGFRRRAHWDQRSHGALCRTH